MPSPLELTYARLCAAWPDVVHPLSAFTAHLTAKLAEGESIEEALQQLHVEDLFLASACAGGSAAAHARFDRQIAPAIERAVASLDSGAAFVEEVHQRVRELVLLPREDGPPRIADFSGRSPLAAWIRVIAAREGVRLIQKRRRDVPAEDDRLANLLTPDAGPELAHLKRLYRAEFRAAIGEAIAALKDREKVLLRQNALDGVSIDRLAALHGVHRATVARWIQSAKESLLAETRAALIERLRVTPSELDSILRLIESQLEASLSGL